MTSNAFCRLAGFLALLLTPVIASAQRTDAPAPALPTPGAPTATTGPDFATAGPGAISAIGPPVQPINSASALSTEPFGAINGVRELPDGRILVNDGARRRLLLMDTTLATVEIVLDSVAQVSNAYGTRPGALIPFRGDSTLFVDPASYSMLVIDPQGRVVRVRSVWRVEHVNAFSNVTGNLGVPGIDARGRIVYRIPATPAPPLVPPPAGVPYFPTPPDSAFIVAADLETRMVDTLTSIRIPKSELVVRQRADGLISAEQVINPLPVSDDWAVLADGRVAVIRALDYRIDYLEPDGTWTSSEKLPFDWRRLTDDDKREMVDSVKTVQGRSAATSYTTAMIRWVNMYNQQYPPDFTAPEGYNLPAGFPQDYRLPTGLTFPTNYIYGCPPGVEPTMLGGGPAGPAGGEPVRSQVIIGGPPPDGALGGIRIQGAPGGGDIRLQGGPPPDGPVGAIPGGAVPGGVAAPPPNAAGGPVASGPAGATGTPSCIPQPAAVAGGSVPPPPTPRIIQVLPPEELPDYRPPLPTANSARADADGNLWIRTVPAEPLPGGIVYDIVDPAGQLVNRYQLPPGYTIVGFGEGKVVYLSMRDQTGLRLARVQLR